MTCKAYVCITSCVLLITSSSAMSQFGKGHKHSPAARDAMLAPLAPLGFQALSETSSSGSSSLNGPFHTYAGLLLLIALALCKTSLTIADLNLHTTMLCHSGLPISTALAICSTSLCLYTAKLGYLRIACTACISWGLLNNLAVWCSL